MHLRTVWRIGGGGDVTGILVCIFRVNSWVRTTADQFYCLATQRVSVSYFLIILLSGSS